MVTTDMMKQYCLPVKKLVRAFVFQLTVGKAGSVDDV